MTNDLPKRSAVPPVEIVPKGYWTFWLVVTVLGGMGSLVMTVYSCLFERRVLVTVICGAASILSAVAWAIFYWRLSRGRSAN